MDNKSYDEIISHLDDIEITSVHGRITQVVGMLIKAVIPQVKMGEICLIKREPEPLIAEVVDDAIMADHPEMLKALAAALKRRDAAVRWDILQKIPREFLEYADCQMVDDLTNAARREYEEVTG